MEQLEDWETELSNWGRWDPDDQWGTLNLITPEKTREAASLVRSGTTVTLQHFVTEEEAMDSQTFSETRHYMTAVDPETGEVRSALDAIEFGLHASVLPWLKERGVAILVGDAVNDVQPSGVEGINRPVHQMTQVFIGLPLVDNGYLKDVAEEAARQERWEFMVSFQINAVPGGTASPFNALATF